jgi:putative effector of murein hydrolase LrgA (UPF0299 family)
LLVLFEELVRPHLELNHLRQQVADVLQQVMNRLFAPATTSIAS